MTASHDKQNAETTPAPATAPPPVIDTAPKTSDFSAHSDSAELPPASPSAPVKDESHRRLPAFVMGMIGGVCVAASLALVALILNPLSDLTERLGVIENGLAGAATRRGLETNDKRLAALEARLDGLRADFDTLNRNPATGSPDISGLKTHLAQLDQALLALQQDAAKVGKPALATTLAQDAARLTLALVVTDKIEQGQPIATELQTLAPLFDDPAGLADLKPWADGTPAQAALVQEFARLYPALLKAAPAPADESVSQFVLRHLRQWVHWRRIDQQETTDPESLLQRINLDLQKGQNEEAARHIRSLPAPMQNVIAPLLRALSQRMDALKAAEHLFQTAMNQLMRSAQTKGGMQ